MLYVLFQNDANKGKLPNSCHEYYEAKIADTKSERAGTYTPKASSQSHL